MLKRQNVFVVKKIRYTVEPRYNELLYDEEPGKTKDIL